MLRANAMRSYALAGEVGVLGALGIAICQINSALFGELSTTLGETFDFNAADNEAGHCGFDDTSEHCRDRLSDLPPSVIVPPWPPDAPGKAEAIAAFPGAAGEGQEASKSRKAGRFKRKLIRKLFTTADSGFPK